MGETLDSLRIRYHYLRKVGCLPNLSNPLSFTEKVQVAKLTWRSPRMVTLSDKVEAKKVVASQLGPEWVTPTLYSGPKLPPRSERQWRAPYVIKCNHCSGRNYFVHKAGPDWLNIENQITRDLARPYGRRFAEWVYTEIAPQVLVEPFIGLGDSPPDYKLFMFGGKFAFTSMIWNRFSASGVQRATFDRNWERLPFVPSSGGSYDGKDIPNPPESYHDMIAGAEVLAADFPFVRIDLYEIDRRPRFGEATFYPNSGLFRMPRQYDLQIGALWPDGTPT